MVKISVKDKLEGARYVQKHFEQVHVVSGGWIPIIKSGATLFAWFKEEDIVLMFKFQLTFSCRGKHFTLVTFPACKVMIIKLTLENYKVKCRCKVSSKQ